jgi:two-component system LytT family response regulator
MINVIVVDDENIARRRLVRLLEETGEARVVAECAGGRDAVARITELEPQMVFLDVQMPDLDGFGVLQELPDTPLPAIVFVTAFDQYAVRAFDVHAVDYLLKPYDTARFREAFARAEERIQSRLRTDEDHRLRTLLRDYLSENGQKGDPDRLDRVAVKVDGALRIVRTADIDWWETDGNYVRLHVGSNSHLIRATATSIEGQLDPKQFLRIHRRYIVNIDRVVEVQPWFGGDSIVLLKGGAKLRLSRTYRERLHSRLLGVRSEGVDALR